MKRFDICTMRGTGLTGGEHLVVVLQHEHLDDLATAVVVPLFLERDLPPIRRLRPVVKLGRRKYIAAVDRLASVPKIQIGSAQGSAENHRFELLEAIDLLFSGF